MRRTYALSFPMEKVRFRILATSTISKNDGPERGRCSPEGERDQRRHASA